MWWVQCYSVLESYLQIADRSVYYSMTMFGNHDREIMWISWTKRKLCHVKWSCALFKFMSPQEVCTCTLTDEGPLFVTEYTWQPLSFSCQGSLDSCLLLAVVARDVWLFICSEQAPRRRKTLCCCKCCAWLMKQFPLMKSFSTHTASLLRDSFTNYQCGAGCLITNCGCTIESW